MDQGSFVIISMALLGAALWYYSRGHKSMRDTFDQYTRDLTALARAGKLDPVIGREKEVERLIHIIARRSKNNPLLIGEPGVGKTSIVQAFASRIATDQVPERLRGMSVIALDLPSLLSGAANHGELERRVREVIAHLAIMRGRVVLFVDELHLIGKGLGPQGGLNVSDILKPELTRSDIAVIGATNWSEYQEVLRNDPAVERRFQPVVVPEPDKATTIRILGGMKGVLERHHGVRLTPEALKAAVDDSARYIHDRFLPDKALDVLDEACAAVAIAAQSKPKTATAKTAPRVTAKDVREVVEGWVEYYRAAHAKR